MDEKVGEVRGGAAASSESSSNSTGPAGRFRLTHDQNNSLFWILFIVDCLIAVGALFSLAVLRDGFVSYEYRIMAVITVILIWTTFNSFDVFWVGDDAWGVFNPLLKAWCMVLILLALVGFAAKTTDSISRWVITFWAPMCFVYQFGAHFIIPEGIKRFRGIGAGKEKGIIIGAGRLAKHLASEINSNQMFHVRVVGVVDDNEDDLARWSLPDVPILGGIDDIMRVIEEQGATTVYISMHSLEIENFENLYLGLMEKNVDINWAPDLLGVTLVNPSVTEIAGVPVLALSETPLIGSKALLKTILDKFLAIVGIILTSPIMIGTAIAIKYSSPGPVFYKQKRHGWNAKEFEIWKFRSMKIHDEEEGVITQATKDDPRVTKVGKFIRKTSIDELPQLFNVLFGTMSMVGPRPHAIEHDNYYAKVIQSYFARHRIKPGITGLAQVNGFRGETETLDKMKFRVEYDLEYINNWSVFLDLKIVVRTFFVLFSKQAY